MGVHEALHPPIAGPKCPARLRGAQGAVRAEGSSGHLSGGPQGAESSAPQSWRWGPRRLDQGWCETDLCLRNDGATTQASVEPKRQTQRRSHRTHGEWLGWQPGARRPV